MEFVNFLRGIFLNFPTNTEAFIDNPYPAIIAVFVLILIFKGKFGFLFYFLISLIIFLIGLFYGIVSPVYSEVVGILVFASCSLVSIGLILFKMLVKSS